MKNILVSTHEYDVTLPFKLLLLLTSAFALGNSFGQITTFPHIEDFELEGIGSTACAGTYPMVSAGWVNETTDTKDWTSDIGGTTSSLTGPSTDFNPGTAAGHYLYLEASSCYGQTAILTTPAFDLAPANLGGATAVEMGFSYHMYGQSMGTLEVEITNDAGATWTNIVPQFTDDQDLWQHMTVNLGAYTGDIVQMRFIGITGTNFYSDMAIDNFSMNLLFSDDIGAVSVDSPTNPLPSGFQFVQASITNYGGNTVNNCNINWSVDGVVQPALAYSNAMAPGQTDNNIILGTYSFTNQTADICVWTSDPNGNPDTDMSNDTICESRCMGLSGVYSIGGATPDYLTFTEAANDLASCGISAPVVFNVAPGVYNEGITIPVVIGSDATNTITFDGGSAATTSIVNSTNNATIALFGTDYITFTNLTVQNTLTTDAWGFYLADTADFVTISNCNILMDESTLLVDVAGIMSSGDILNDLTESNGCNNLVIDGCLIRGGEKGISMEGLTTFADWMDGLTITNNEIYMVDDYPIYLDNQRNLNISGNIIDSIQNVGGDGPYMFDIVDFTFENNVVNAPDYGWYISDGNFNGDGAPTGTSTFINNMISSSSDRAVYFLDVEQTNFWHNSLYNEGTGGGALVIDNPFNMDIRNNAFVSDADYAIEALDDLTTGSNTVDYNSYWSNSATFFVYEAGAISDLATWQTNQPTLNINSVNEDPVYVSSTDLHAVSITFDDLGDNSLGILTDIDGEARPMGVNVDIGADEYTPLTKDASLVMFLSPTSTACGESTADVSVIITNFADTIFTLPVTVEVTGAVTQTLNATYNDTLLFNDIDTLFMGTINTYNGGTVNFEAYTVYPGEQNTSNDTILYSADYVPFEPVVGGAIPTCGADTAYVWADTTYTSAYTWWDSPTGGNMVNSGFDYWIPSVTTQDTYYIEYVGGADQYNFIQTTFAGGNGCGGGNMFDVEAVSGDTISGFKLNLNNAAGTMSTVNVYYKTGTYIGSELNSAAWTLEGSYIVESNGSGNPSELFSLNNGIIIPSGNQVIGVYVEFDASYTNGLNTYTNGNVTVNTGSGLCSPFGGNNPSRSFNGDIHFGYDKCSSFRTPVQSNTTPEADVNLGNDIVECEQNGATVLSTSISLTNYMWEPSGNTGATETITASGQYIVTATDGAGCTSSDTVLVIYQDCASIDEINNGIETMIVYPNPNNGLFNIQLQAQAGVEIKSIEVRSLDGKLIESAQLNNANGLIKTTFDLTNQSTGVYLINVLTSEGTSVEKITIH